MSVHGKQNERKIGIVVEALPNTLFRVSFEGEDSIICYLAGKMRFHRIRILVGDKVEVEFDQYNQERGKIIRRM